MKKNKLLKKTIFTVLSFVSIATVAKAQTDTLEIGYIPILPDSQFFVAYESGTLLPKDQKSNVVSYQSGPSITQSLIANNIDVAYVGIGPVMVAKAHGADIQVVASNIVEQVSVVATGELAKFWDSNNHDFAAAVQSFTQAKGRRPIIASYPKGSVPELSLRYWLENKLKLPKDAVERIYQGESQIQQALRTKAVDVAAVLEPTVSQVLEFDKGSRVIAQASDLFPNQPGAVLAVRSQLIKDRPELVKKLVAAHIQSTKMLRNEPAKAAKYVQKYVGGGRLPISLIKTAIERSKDQFQDNPSKIIESTKKLQQFQVKNGAKKVEQVDVDQLFDTTFYKSAESSVGKTSE